MLKEIFYINEYDSFRNGYNSTLGGEVGEPNISHADFSGEKNPFYGKGHMISGEKNPMYGKTFYDVWVEKYGKEIADKKKEEWLKNKRKKIAPCHL